MAGLALSSSSRRGYSSSPSNGSTDSENDLAPRGSRRPLTASIMTSSSIAQSLLLLLVAMNIYSDLGVAAAAASVHPPASSSLQHGQPRRALPHTTTTSSSRTNTLLSKSGTLETFEKYSNNTNPFRVMDEQEITWDAQERKRRIQERRDRAREWLQRRHVGPPPRSQLEPLSDPQLHSLRQRNLSWFSSGNNVNTMAHSANYLADPSQDYDKWAQAYRMLGGYIDCDHDKEASHSNDNKNNGQACSRWMLWAAYVNPNYQGGEYDEYYGDDPQGVLDCHNPDTEWVLLGVYRQEFYQFIEQISKHLWAIDEYEYVVALAGLSYMTDEDCRQIGYDSSGNTLYAGVMPTAYGKFQMALYKDEYCITPDTSSGMTYDDFGMQSNIDLGSKDGADDDNAYSWAYDWWYDTQEYTLTQLNDVYEEFKYCTSCVDYPTYQDGYFIGDDGTDDEDLINQCWKFYSHDSYTCEAECISLAHAQGSILQVKYGDITFGKTISGFYSGTVSSGSSGYSSVPQESAIQKLLANVALTASFLLFVATFLAFAVARRSRYRESSRSRRLLDDDDEGRSRKSRKSHKTGDGVFRTSRSKSEGRKSSRSKGRSSSNKSLSSKRASSSEYRPPRETSPRSKSAGRTEEYF